MPARLPSKPVGGAESKKKVRTQEPGEAEDGKYCGMQLMQPKLMHLEFQIVSLSSNQI